MNLHYLFAKDSAEIRDEDVTSLNRLLRQLTKSPRELTRQDVETVIASGHLLLVRDPDANRRIVGTACLVPFTTLTRKHGRVEDVIVDEDYRGQGIARRMVQELLSVAHAEGVAQVELTSNPSRQAANALYQSMSFRPVATNVYRLDLG
jgi:ribosomal protein S18 acetylase RimI-like enzyme